MTDHLLLVPGDHPEIRPNIAAHVRWLNDPELMQFSEQRHKTHTVETQKEYLRSFDYINSFFWGIYPHGMPSPLGSIAAHCDWHNKIADIGVLIGAFQRRGYASEAWRAVIDFLILRGIKKIEAGCMASNVAMLRVFGKTGMMIEGKRRGHFLLDNKPEDLIMAARFA